MSVKINGNEGITNATWANLTKPTSPDVGQQGYNTDLGALETWTGGAWAQSISAPGGNITASYFIGNGSLLTNINGANIVGNVGNGSGNVTSNTVTSNTVTSNSITSNTIVINNTANVGNLVTGGTINATNTITGGNIVSNGNITGGNLSIGNTITVTSIIEGQSTLTYAATTNINLSNGDFFQVTCVSGTSATVSFTTSNVCLLYTSPSPRDRQKSRMPSSA